MTPAWAQRQKALVRDCVVSPDVCHQLVARLGAFVAPSQPVLATEAGQRTVPLSLQGLLSHVPRKNAADIATLVAVERVVLHACLGPATWEQRPWGRVVVGQVVEPLGAPDGLIACAPSSFPQRGTPAVGGKRQGWRHRGQVDTCQVGVCLGYVSRYAPAVLDVRLSLPADWARDAPRRAACHGPPAVRDHTRHEPCLERRDAWSAPGPHGWGPGEDALGRPTRVRGELRARGERYGLGGPCTTTVRALEAPGPAEHGRGRRPKAPWQAVSAWRHALAPAGWTRLPGRAGATGPVARAMGTRRVQTRLERKRTGPEEWLGVTRRPRTDASTSAGTAAREATEHDGRDSDRYSLTPTSPATSELLEPSRAELARVSTAGLCLAAGCKRGNGEAGLDAYQGRTWEGWQHPLGLSLSAVWVVIGETHRGQQFTPALTLPHVRYGLSVLRLEVFCTPGIDSLCRQVYRH
jgi:hypothetical protein